MDASTDVVDLRSDTVTRPTRDMREAMARAEVGDDVYGEDPTVRALEERVAAVVGKEAALFVPSGTMANQIAILIHTRRGDEVVVGARAHSFSFESGAGAAIGGVQFAVVGTSGLFAADDVEAALHPGHIVYPRTSLVMIENTHNRAGGRVFPQTEILRIADVAAPRGIRMHLDGARLWNASTATGRAESELARPFDTVSVCFSKGLGAPIGSAICGAADALREARRYRKMLGGGMRQAGVIAAGALFALEHNRARLADDHEAAREVARIVSQGRGASVDVDTVETNMVNVELSSSDENHVVEEARRRGVLVNATGPRALRLVTHLDVPLERAKVGARRLVQAIEACAARGGS
jgi:threonine aldolase